MVVIFDESLKKRPDCVFHSKNNTSHIIIAVSDVEYQNNHSIDAISHLKRPLTEFHVGKGHIRAIRSS